MSVGSGGDVVGPLLSVAMAPDWVLSVVTFGICVGGAGTELGGDGPGFCSTLVGVVLGFGGSNDGVGGGGNGVLLVVLTGGISELETGGDTVFSPIPSPPPILPMIAFRSTWLGVLIGTVPTIDDGSGTELVTLLLLIRADELEICCPIPPLPGRHRDGGGCI